MVTKMDQTMQYFNIVQFTTYMLTISTTNILLLLIDISMWYLLVVYSFYQNERGDN